MLNTIREPRAGVADQVFERPRSYVGQDGVVVIWNGCDEVETNKPELLEVFPVEEFANRVKRPEQRFIPALRMCDVSGDERLAIVEDDQGRPVGIVTTKDLVEPLTGELADL